MRKVAGDHPFCVLISMNSHTFHICFILFILLSYLIFDFVCLTLTSVDTHGIAKYARTYIRDIHTQAHTQQKQGKRKEGRGWVFRRLEERGYRGGQDHILTTLDRHEYFPVFHHLQKDNKRKQRHSLKLGKKRRENSKRNYYNISPRVIIKAIIVITRRHIPTNPSTVIRVRVSRSYGVHGDACSNNLNSGTHP